MFPTLLYRSPQPRVSAKMRHEGYVPEDFRETKMLESLENESQQIQDPEPDAGKRGTQERLEARKEGRLEETPRQRP